MFCFYFGMFANLTPPVALAAFAAAGIAGGSPMKTGWASVKLALAGFILPYMFVYNTDLLLLDTPLAKAIQFAVTAAVGVFLISTAVEGFLFTKAFGPARKRMIQSLGRRCHAAGWVTVSGKAIANPKNVKVAIGTPFSYILDYCGVNREVVFKLTTISFSSG